MKFIDSILEALGVRPKSKRLPKWQDRWRELHTARGITKVHQVERALLRAAKRGGEVNQAIESVFADLQKSFTPITNERTLFNQGCRPFESLERAINTASIRATLGHTALGAAIDDLMTDDEERLYRGLARALKTTPSETLERRLRTRYVYSFVRRDMSPEQRLVQTGHALYEAGHELALRNGETKPWQVGVEHTHLVCVDVANEAELIEAFGKLHKRVPVVPFYEDDASMTAFAALPVRLSGRELFRGYGKLTLPQEPVERQVWTVNVPDEVSLAEVDYWLSGTQTKPASREHDPKMEACYHSGEHDYGL
jgi:DNA-binding HxlR family transcriptional regulator